jgi:hypothetical protein
MGTKLVEVIGRLPERAVKTEWRIDVNSSMPVNAINLKSIGALKVV